MNVAAPGTTGTIAGLVRSTAVAAVPTASPGNGNASGQNRDDGAGADQAVARFRVDAARFAGAAENLKALRAEITAARAATLAAQEDAENPGTATARHAIERTGGQLAAVLSAKLGGRAFRGVVEAGADAGENLLNVLGTSLSRSGGVAPGHAATGTDEAVSAPPPPAPAAADTPAAAPDDLVPAAPPATSGGTTPTDPGGDTPPAHGGHGKPPAHGGHGPPPAHGGHGKPYAPGEILRDLMERLANFAKNDGPRGMSDIRVEAAGGTEGPMPGGTLAVASAARQAADAYRKAAALASRR
jgi:hypothetical protein